MPVKLLKTKQICDDRGWFSEVFNERIFERLGVVDRFVQDNQSYSSSVGTLRGLHFQRPPHAQAKLVRCVRGRVFDVAVDLRAGSPTFTKWVSAELSAANAHQLFLPIGFAHGFLTLEPDSEVLYKVSDYYSKTSDAGIIWNDPTIAIDWPGESVSFILSKKDRELPTLSQFDSPFLYYGDPLGAVHLEEI